MRPNATTRDRLLAQVATLNWVHRIDLGNGVSTPGRWGEPNPCLMRALDAVDFRGKKVLDIGCWDGLYSFEAEKRGAAEIYATDLVSQRDFVDHPTFTLAAKILGSRATYHPNVSVYDVEKLGVDGFDVVIYAGIYYHLKDPLRSFAKLRRVMKDGGTIIVEGAAIDSEDCHARFSYREPYLGDHSNWWIPTVGCLREWVECSFLAVEHELGVWDTGHGNPRCTLIARAVSRADAYYIRPDAELADFDLNVYPRKFGDPIVETRSAAGRQSRRWIHGSPMTRLRGPFATRLRRWARKLAGSTRPD